MSHFFVHVAFSVGWIKCLITQSSNIFRPRKQTLISPEMFFETSYEHITINQAKGKKPLKGRFFSMKYKQHWKNISAEKADWHSIEDIFFKDQQFCIIYYNIWVALTKLLGVGY